MITVKGWRRMIVALAGVASVDAIEILVVGGMSVYGQLALTSIVLGYFGFDAWKKKKV